MNHSQNIDSVRLIRKVFHDKDLAGKNDILLVSNVILHVHVHFASMLSLMLHQLLGFDSIHNPPSTDWGGQRRHTTPSFHQPSIRPISLYLPSWPPRTSAS